jgi:hypothetical protein
MISYSRSRDHHISISFNRSRKAFNKRESQSHHLSPYNIMTEQRPSRLPRQKALASSNQFPPISRQLLKNSTGLLHLRRFQAKHQAFSNSSLHQREPSWIYRMRLRVCRWCIGRQRGSRILPCGERRQRMDLTTTEKTGHGLLLLMK